MIVPPGRVRAAIAHPRFCCECPHRATARNRPEGGSPTMAAAEMTARYSRINPHVTTSPTRIRPPARIRALTPPCPRIAL